MARWRRWARGWLPASWLWIVFVGALGGLVGGGLVAWWMHRPVGLTDRSWTAAGLIATVTGVLAAILGILAALAVAFQWLVDPFQADD